MGKAMTNNVKRMHKEAQMSGQNKNKKHDEELSTSESEGAYICI